MKYLLIFILLTSCYTARRLKDKNIPAPGYIVFGKDTVQSDPDRFRPRYYQAGLFNITRIDSLNGYYILYAKKEDELFKIVSKKEVCKVCRRITLNNSYNMELNSALFSPDFPLADLPDIGLRIDDSTLITNEPAYGYNIFGTKNLRGLGYIKTPKNARR